MVTCIHIPKQTNTSLKICSLSITLFHYFYSQNLLKPNFSMLVTKTIPAIKLFSLLQKCNTIKQITQIHAQIILNNFSNKNFILVKLLSLYLSFGYPKNALLTFNEIKNPTTNIWNQIIRTHDKSFVLFKKMLKNEVKPDGYTYSFVIRACGRKKMVNEGKQVHGKVVKNGFLSDVFICTNLVNFYGGDIRDASRVFDEMGVKNVVTWNAMLGSYVKIKNIDEAFRVFTDMPEKSVVSWTTMISGCAENGRSKQAISLFHEMKRRNVEFDQVAMVAILSACAELGDIELGVWVHSYVLENFFFENQRLKVSLNNAIIHMYASCGMIEEAYKVFLGMTKKSVVSWTSMITGYAKQGRGEEALRTFYWMLCEPDAKPDDITLLGVLSACSHSGFVEEGRQIFETMFQRWGIEPKIEHYGCFVDLLSRAGFLDEACRVVETMPIKPNDVIWGAILGGCTIHKNVELGSRIAERLMVDLDPDRAADYLVLVSNMYATNMKWQDVAKLREKVVKMDVKKPPGRSWVQVEGVVHEFYAYDMNHEHEVPIYQVLDGIYAHAKGDKDTLDFPDLEVLDDIQRLWH